jgi:hypothetical protein
MISQMMIYQLPTGLVCTLSMRTTTAGLAASPHAAFASAPSIQEDDFTFILKLVLGMTVLLK